MLQVLDDDMALNPTELADGFEAWRQFGRGQRLVGFFARQALLERDRYAYVVEPRSSYNIALTGAAFVDRAFSRAYWSPTAEPLRAMVDELFNCEDLAINALVGPSLAQPAFADLAGNMTGLAPLFLASSIHAVGTVGGAPGRPAPS